MAGKCLGLAHVEEEGHVFVRFVQHPPLLTSRSEGPVIKRGTMTQRAAVAAARVMAVTKTKTVMAQSIPPDTFVGDATRLMRSSNTSGGKKKKKKKKNGCPQKTCFTPARGAECACQCSQADANQDACANLCHQERKQEETRGRFSGLEDEVLFLFTCWHFGSGGLFSMDTVFPVNKVFFFFPE